MDEVRNSDGAAAGKMSTARARRCPTLAGDAIADAIATFSVAPTLEPVIQVSRFSAPSGVVARIYTGRTGAVALSVIEAVKA